MRCQGVVNNTVNILVMILSIISLHPSKNAPSFNSFERLCAERYASYLGQEFNTFSPGTWYTAVKPYHSGIFPFMAMDLMIHYKCYPCQLFFGHDLLPYTANDNHQVYLDDLLQNQVQQTLKGNSTSQSSLHFKGFGNRIDIGLNALATLYMEILSSLTKVECQVLFEIRHLQFQRAQDPCESGTFGLQKQVAEKLGKSPVSIHKSLRSSKYMLLAETANAMKQMMV